MGAVLVVSSLLVFKASTEDLTLPKQDYTEFKKLTFLVHGSVRRYRATIVWLGLVVLCLLISVGQVGAGGYEIVPYPPIAGQPFTIHVLGKGPIIVYSGSGCVGSAVGVGEGVVVTLTLPAGQYSFPAPSFGCVDFFRDGLASIAHLTHCKTIMSKQFSHLQHP